MSDLRQQLQFLLADSNGRVAVVGIGNPLKGDDAVGLAVVDRLEERGTEDVLLVRAESAPENFTGPIRSYEPDHVLMVDSAEMGAPPGEARVVPLDAILGNRISTHTSSLGTLIRFLERTTGSIVTLIGIQPLNMEFGSGLSPVAESASKEVAYAIYDAIMESRTKK